MHCAIHDGEVLRVGGVELQAIETPSHTPESISWLVSENGRPTKLMTGDTLFIGDVGRPDLAGSRGYTTEQMASMLLRFPPPSQRPLHHRQPCQQLRLSSQQCGDLHLGLQVDLVVVLCQQLVFR